MKKLMVLVISLMVTGIVFAQADRNKMSSGKMDTSGNVLYTCPMHPEVMALKSGNCPKCGMNLVPKKVQEVYTCPMHNDVVSDKPGKCPKCGMSMVEKKMHGMNKDSMQMKH